MSDSSRKEGFRQAQWAGFRQAQSPGVDRFSMRYGAPALLLGWLATFVLFCFSMTVASMAATGGDTGLGWYFLPISLIYGFPFASILGLPLAILLAWPLRRIHRQWLHVGAFALATGLACWLVVAAVGGWTNTGSGAGIGLLAAVSSAIGRAAVIPLVARRNRPNPARQPSPPAGE
jgi:hypothetical protein